MCDTTAKKNYETTKKRPNACKSVSNKIYIKYGFYGWQYSDHHHEWTLNSLKLFYRSIFLWSLILSKSALFDELFCLVSPPVLANYPYTRDIQKSTHWIVNMSVLLIVYANIKKIIEYAGPSTIDVAGKQFVIVKWQISVSVSVYTCIFKRSVYSIQMNQIQFAWIEKEQQPIWLTSDSIDIRMNYYIHKNWSPLD